MLVSLSFPLLYSESKGHKGNVHGLQINSAFWHNLTNQDTITNIVAKGMRALINTLYATYPASNHGQKNDKVLNILKQLRNFIA